MKYMEVKRNNRYITGVVGQDIKLTLMQRIRLLFFRGITVALVGPDVYRAKSTQAGEGGQDA